MKLKQKLIVGALSASMLMTCAVTCGNGMIPDKLGISITASADITSGLFTYTISGTNATITGYTGTAANVTIPATINGYKVVAIGNNSFYNKTMTTVTISKGITTIGKWAFQSCANLQTVIIPEGVTSIDICAFQFCSNLSSVTLPSTLTTLLGSVFSCCSSLNTITIPSKVTSIEANTFAECTNLQTVNIPSGVTKIDTYAFSKCKNLKSITLPSQLSIIGNYAFSGSGLSGNLTIPASVTKVSRGAFTSCPIASLSVSGNTTIDTSAFSGCTSLASASMPAVITIGESAFSGCTSLASASMPVVTTIGSLAFSGCTSLPSISMPAVTTIGSSAFNGCTNLSNIVIDISKTIDGSAFNYCTNLQYINGSKATLVNPKEGYPYFNNNLNTFIMNNFRTADDVGFINSYINYETHYIVSQVTTSSMTDMQKAVALHDWVCNKVIYTTGNTNDKENHVDSSIFLNDYTVCDGYARGYCLLLQAAGLEAYCVHKTGVHAWNIVKLGNHYFHVDTCWDDGNGTFTYNWFLKSDDSLNIFGGAHSNWVLNKPSSLYNYVQSTLPVCTYSMGDINMDGCINGSDVTLLQQYLVGAATIASGDGVLADLTHDGVVNVYDLILLKRMIV